MDRDPLGVMSLDSSAAATPCDACLERVHCRLTSDCCEAFVTFVRGQPWRAKPREPSPELAEAIWNVEHDEPEPEPVECESEPVIEMETAPSPPELPPEGRRCSECDRTDVHARGLCGACYQRAKTQAAPPKSCIECGRTVRATSRCRECVTRARGERCSECGGLGVLARGKCRSCYERGRARRRRGRTAETVETETPGSARMG